MFKFDNQADGQLGKKFYHFGAKLYDFSKGKLGFDDIAKVSLISDPQNGEDTLGKTAYYDPNSAEIVLYADGRHVKDILRSFSHELVHHHQMCNGSLTGESDASDGYAQRDPHLREMEKEAYLKGNMIFRDWEDNYKMKRKEKMKEQNGVRQTTRMDQKGYGGEGQEWHDYPSGIGISYSVSQGGNDTADGETGEVKLEVIVADASGEIMRVDGDQVVAIVEPKVLRTLHSYLKQGGDDPAKIAHILGHTPEGYGSTRESKEEKKNPFALDPHKDLTVLKHKRELRFGKVCERLGVKFDPSKLVVDDKKESK